MDAHKEKINSKNWKRELSSIIRLILARAQLAKDVATCLWQNNQLKPHFLLLAAQYSDKKVKEMLKELKKFKEKVSEAALQKLIPDSVVDSIRDALLIL